MKPINAKRLQSLKACRTQVQKFQEIFGDTDAPLTVETAIQYATEFDWDWAAQNLLKAPHLKACQEAVASLWKAYDEAEAPLSKAYQEAVASLWKAYDEAVAPLWKAYQEEIISLWEAYQEAVAPHLKACQEAEARTFAELYIQQESKS